MRTSHRLDLVLVPSPGDVHATDAVLRLWSNLESAAVVTSDGRPGAEAHRWVKGGFRRMHVDQPGAVTLYANRQGGFSAHCPVEGTVITGAFSRALSAARDGAPWTLVCPACAAKHRLQEIVGRPAFAFGAVALVTSDVASPTLAPGGRDWAAQELENAAVVLRRG